MIDGFYAMYYTGAIGSGVGLLAIKNGIVTGVDVVGGRYDGTYSSNESAGNYDIKIKMTFPPGTSLVTGAIVGAQPLTMDLNASLPASLGGEKPVGIQTQTGPVNVIFRKLRDFLG